MHAVAGRTVTISQSLFATTVANRHSSLQKSQIWHFSKAFGNVWSKWRKACGNPVHNVIKDVCCHAVQLPV